MSSGHVSVCVVIQASTLSYTEPVFPSAFYLTHSPSNRKSILALVGQQIPGVLTGCSARDTVQRPKPGNNFSATHSAQPLCPERGAGSAHHSAGCRLPPPGGRGAAGWLRAPPARPPWRAGCAPGGRRCERFAPAPLSGPAGGSTRRRG